VGAAPFAILALQRVRVLIFSSIVLSARDEIDPQNSSAGRVAVHLRQSQTPHRLQNPQTVRHPLIFVCDLRNSGVMLSGRAGRYESYLPQTERWAARQSWGIPV
jgi:hypothetical protein